MEQKSRPIKKSSTTQSQKANLINSNLNNNLNYWNKDEDTKLLSLINDSINHKGNKIKWKFIASHFLNKGTAPGSIQVLLASAR